jgi:hypothetical protein
MNIRRFRGETVIMTRSFSMFFLLPFIPAFAAAAVSIGEAVGIGMSVVGIGAAIKGTAGYNQAKTVRKTANVEYQDMVLCLKRKARAVQNRFTAFGILKLRTYTGVIQKAVKVLSRFKDIDLSSFRDMQVEHITFLKDEITLLETSCIKASDVLSCLAVGVNTAVNDRIPYKDTPPLVQSVGAFGIKEVPGNGLPNIPYAAIALAGISWGLSGNAAKSAAEADAMLLDQEKEKMKAVLAGFRAMGDRVTEGESLIATLSEKLKAVLETLTQPEKETVKTACAATIEAAIALTRALKQVIETDICTGNGMINAQSGVVFHKIRKEYGGTGNV